MTNLEDLSKDQLIEAVKQLQNIAMEHDPESVIMHLRSDTMEALSAKQTLHIEVEVSSLDPVTIPNLRHSSEVLADYIGDWFSNEEPSGYLGITKVHISRMTYGDQEVVNVV